MDKRALLIKRHFDTGAKGESLATVSKRLTGSGTSPPPPPPLYIGKYLSMILIMPPNACV